MRRRDFLAGLGGAAAAWPSAVRAQQATVPVVGFLNLQSAASWQEPVAAFRQGLKEMGYVEGRNVAIEFRWADARPERLPALVAELVQRNVAVIAATGGNNTGLAAKAVTTTIPIVFTSGDDPRRYGLVESLNRPGGNITGVSWFSGELGPKRLEIMRELMPRAKTVAFLANPTNAEAAHQIPDMEKAARGFGMQFVGLPVSNANEIDAAFATMVQRRADILIMAGDPFLTNARSQIIALATQHAIPTMYLNREQAGSEGLISYGNSLGDGYRRAGVMTGRILRGIKPADLPVDQATKFELVVNLKIAQSLGLTTSREFLLRADELLE
jgi:putative ABC transport system substrate-binding protein